MTIRDPSAHREAAAIGWYIADDDARWKGREENSSCGWIGSIWTGQWRVGR
jgi:hypothetical protein